MTLATRVHGEGPAVIWLHGYTMDSSTWRELWSLMPGWRHVGVDLPGHGRSAPLEPGTTLPGVAAEVAEVAREQGASRMVALSFGTIVALQVAIDSPALLTRLVLAAPALGGGQTEPGADDRYRELLALYLAGASAAELTDRWMFSPPDIFRGTEAHPLLRFRLRQVILRHSWAELGSGAMAGLARHRQSTGQLSRLRPSLQVLVGEQDLPVTTAVARSMAAEVPRVRLEVARCCGHLFPLEDPAQVAPLIEDHLRPRLRGHDARGRPHATR